MFNAYHENGKFYKTTALVWTRWLEVGTCVMEPITALVWSDRIILNGLTRTECMSIRKVTKKEMKIIILTKETPTKQAEWKRMIHVANPKSTR